MTELETIRHSAAHVMANAILRLWPEAQFAAGPPVENGFYYDVDLPHRITPEDFGKIEGEMASIVAQTQPFLREEISREEALAMGRRGELAGLTARDEPSRFKLDIITRIPEGEKITLFRNGSFTDLCAGPHVADTSRVGAFKLTHVASAFYQGDEKNPQLQRIYGTAFPSAAEMENWFALLEEAKKRDHRKIGKELGLFHIDDAVGQGLILWTPKGAVIRQEMQNFISGDSQSSLIGCGVSIPFGLDLDHVTGMVHVKDVFRIIATGAARPATIEGLIRQPRYVPSSMRILDLLAEMRETRTHLAIVLNEYSGTDGLVTIENLVEEIVGDIEDEHDAPAAPPVIARPDGSFLTDARLTIEAFEYQTGIHLSPLDGEDIDTLGGYVTHLSGRVPHVGESFRNEDGLNFEVLKMDQSRVDRLRIGVSRRAGDQV